MGSIFSMGEVGAFVWQRIEAGCSSGEIRDAVAARYDVDAARAGEDVAVLLQALLEKVLSCGPRHTARRRPTPVPPTGFHTCGPNFTAMTIWWTCWRSIPRCPGWATGRGGIRAMESSAAVGL
jgi:Coenzyme PQQ synthesis protein D (PqqD)